MTQRLIVSSLMCLLFSGCFHGYYIQSNPNHPITSTESGKPMSEGAIAITGSAQALVSGDNEVYFRKGQKKGTLADLMHDTNTVPADRSIGLGFKYQTSKKVGVGAGLLYSENLDAFVPDREPYERLTFYIENGFYEHLTTSDNPWIASIHLKVGVSLFSRDRTYISEGSLFNTHDLTTEKHAPNQHALFELLAEPILYGPIVNSIGVTIAPQYYATMFSRNLHQRMGFRLGIVIEPTRYLRFTASSPIMTKNWIFGQAARQTDINYDQPQDFNTISSVFRNINIGVQFILNP